MGVTVKSNNYDIDLGYAGFNNLRTKVAKLTAEDIGLHYERLNEGLYLYGEHRKMFFEEYDKRIQELSEKYNGEKDGILNFLYAPDGNAEISVEDCKAVWEVIKDYDDNVMYGYCGRPDCAMFKDFKRIVKDCIDSNCHMEWF